MGEEYKVTAVPWDKQEVHHGLSGVEVTHLPTGLTVRVTKHRARLANLEEALRRLRRRGPWLVGNNANGGRDG